MPSAQAALIVPATSASSTVRPLSRTDNANASEMENRGLEPGLRSVPTATAAPASTVCGRAQRVFQDEARHLEEWSRWWNLLQSSQSVPGRKPPDDQRLAHRSLPKLHAANAMELITVQLDCEAVLLRPMEQLLCFSDMPGLFLDKDIDGCGQLASGHFGDQFFAYS